MKRCTASIIPCDDYENAPEALDRAIDAIDGLDWVTPGMRVGVKANLVAALKPEAGATTHPVLVAALTKRLVSLGTEVIVGDSPGGLFTPAILKGIYSATGMKLAEEAGAKLNLNCEHHTVSIEGLKTHSLAYCDWLTECDAIIDFCKLKSHGMVGMSGAVKNLFGVVPGLLKPQMHYQYPDVNDFADMIVDINEFVRPRLALADAVWGMEGNGPTAGTPKPMGVLLASKSPHEADLACAHIIGLTREDVPTLQEAYERGLIPADVSGLTISGDLDAFLVPDFERIVTKNDLLFRKKLPGRAGEALAAFLHKCLCSEPRPVKAECVGCGKCADICPAEAIAMRDRLPSIDRKKCIHCFCCQEFCPRGAMKVARPFIARVLNK